MAWRGVILIVASATLSVPLSACRHGTDAPPPPDARRPVLKSEAELSAERDARIRSGEVVPSDSPVLESELQPGPTSRPAPLLPSRNSIRSDVLMVNNSVLSVPEVLYALREWIARTRESQTPRGFLERLRSHVRTHVTREIGSLLVYEKALADLDEPALANLDQAVEREINALVSHDYSGSVAQLEAHLERHGLTMEQWRGMVKRQLVVSSYTRQTLAPQIQVRRDELLAYYRDHHTSYSSDETRELLMIELPFDRFLPEGVSWQAASPSVQARAKLEAKRRARAALEALEQRDFRDVAREYSLGLHADNGGSWGALAQPLQPPYDELSRRIFEFEEGQFSEPIETVTGWYIVQCGRIEPATTTPFSEVQDEIRDELENQRFNKLASDYVFRLAEKATVSDLNGFINSVVDRAIASLPGETASD